jgi:hypothetical protein
VIRIDAVWLAVEPLDMRAGGCSAREARLLYAGVRIGAWSPSVRFWEDESISKPDIMRRGATRDLTDQSVRNTFDEIAAVAARSK